jgi:hypothetical protein
MGTCCGSDPIRATTCHLCDRGPRFQGPRRAADCLHVAGGARTFAELLDAALAQPAVAGRLIETAPQTFLYVRPISAWPRFRALTPSRAAAPFGAPVSRSATVRRRASHHTLSVEQQHALDRLIALGAALDAGFSGRELRSAFRSLARRFHPDRHPHCTDAERARLSRQFAAIKDDYQRLCATGVSGTPSRA